MKPRLVLFLLIVLVGQTALAKEAEVGKEAPFFFLRTYNAEKSGQDRFYLDRAVGQKLENGKKILLLSFFNIDCKPCRKELPFFQKLYSKYEKDGLGIVAVACDNHKEKIAEVEAFVKKSGFSFPVLKDTSLILMRRYSVESFPTLFFIDSKGVIEEIRVGYNEEKMPFPLAKLQEKLGVKQEGLDEKKKKPKKKQKRKKRK
jgi:peroxiredoxin